MESADTEPAGENSYADEIQGRKLYMDKLESLPRGDEQNMTSKTGTGDNVRPRTKRTCSTKAREDQNDERRSRGPKVTSN